MRRIESTAMIGRFIHKRKGVPKDFFKLVIIKRIVMPVNFSIRPATESDVPQILSFIKALAEYEKLVHMLEATEKSITESLFGPVKYAEAVIGYYDQDPIGFALYCYSFSTLAGRPSLHLDDLFIKPEYRGKGFGKSFLAYLAQLAHEKKCRRFEWWVLKENEPAIGFYESLGAERRDEIVLCRIQGKSLIKLADEFAL
jgi:GNAT superfamily N-acetyltransferase